MVSNFDRIVSFVICSSYFFPACRSLAASLFNSAQQVWRYPTNLHEPATKTPPHLWSLHFTFSHFLSQMSVLKQSSEDFENIHTFQTPGNIHYILKDCYMWYSCTTLLFWRNRNLLLTKQKLPSESQHILGITCICSVNQHIRFLIHKRVTLNDDQWQGNTLKIAYC